MHARFVLMLVLFLSLLFWVFDVGIGQAEPAELQSHAAVLPGVVAGVEGHAVAVFGKGVSRVLRQGDGVAVGEGIRVSSGGTVELLWERRALFTLMEKSSLSVQESRSGSIALTVTEGTVRLAYSYNEGNPSDTLTVYTPAFKSVLRGGIVEVTVDSLPDGPSATNVAQRRPESVRPHGSIRVMEGQTHVEPIAAGATASMVKAGYAFQSATGTGEAVRSFSATNTSKPITVGPSLPARLPRMVQVHVDHALEVERALRQPARDQGEPEPLHEQSKGAIVATSLGIPLTTIANATSATSSVSTASSFTPAPTVSPGGHGGVASVGGSGGGAQAGPPAVTVTPVPAIAPPTVTATQSGGINSASLLREVLKDVSGGNNGRGKGKGKD